MPSIGEMTGGIGGFLLLALLVKYVCQGANFTLAVWEPVDAELAAEVQVRQSVRMSVEVNGREECLDMSVQCV